MIIYIIFILAFSLNAQGQSYQIYLEADKQAAAGNYETAFQLIEDQKETDQCRVLGYYWSWVALYSDTRNSLTVQFPSGSSSKNVLGTTFTYKFKNSEALGALLNTGCSSNGNLSKAAGILSWELLENYKTSALSKRIELGYLKKDVELEKLEEAYQEKFLNLSDKAGSHFKKALQLGVYDSITTFGLANSLEYQSKYREAIRYYKKAYALNSNYYLALLKTAACFGKTGDWDSCSVYAQKVIFRSDEESELAVAHRLQAEAFWYGQKNKKKAKKSYKKANKLDAGEYDNSISYIGFLQESGKHKKAMKQAIKFLKNNKDNSHIYSGLSFIFKDKEMGKIIKKASD